MQRLLLECALAAGLGHTYTAFAQGEPASEAPAPSPVRARVETFPPRSLAADDVEYLVWISGASESESQVIRAWATTVFERGLNRDPEGSDRFVKALLKSHDSSARGAAQAIARLREVAQANPAWDQAAFDRALADWKVAVQRRIDALIDSGVVSAIAPSDLSPPIASTVPGTDSAPREDLDGPP